MQTRERNCSLRNQQRRNFGPVSTAVKSLPYENPRRPSRLADVHEDLPAARAAGARAGRRGGARAGHEVRLIDLQVEIARDSSCAWSTTWRPDVVAFSCNYLANIPEVVDLAKATKARLPEQLRLRRRPQRLVRRRRRSWSTARARSTACCGARARPGSRRCSPRSRAGGDLAEVPGAVTAAGEGPPPGFVHSLDTLLPARDLLRHRRKYFIGVLDPCASIEFSRGCPWDCSFCSAWTFYGRSYRIVSPERVVEELRAIREPGVFIVDDVAFIHRAARLRIGEAIARAASGSSYYLETRGDVLLRNKEVFRFWKTLGVEYMFLGLEAIDEEGLKKYRKRVPLGRNFEALEFARSLGINVAINIIADPRLGPRALRRGPRVVPRGARDREHQRQHALSRHRELAHRGAPAADPRLPAVRHPARGAADPAAAGRVLRGAGRRPSECSTEASRWRSAWDVLGIARRLLLRGQTNFVRILFKFNSVYRPELQLADHARPVATRCRCRRRPRSRSRTRPHLYVHAPRGRAGRAIDAATEPLSTRRAWGRAVDRSHRPSACLAGHCGRGRRFPDCRTRQRGKFMSKGVFWPSPPRSVACRDGAAGHGRRAQPVPGYAPPGAPRGPELSKAARGSAITALFWKTSRSHRLPRRPRASRPNRSTSTGSRSRISISPLQKRTRRRISRSCAPRVSRSTQNRSTLSICAT